MITCFNVSFDVSKSEWPKFRRAYKRASVTYKDRRRKWVGLIVRLDEYIGPPGGYCVTMHCLTVLNPQYEELLNVPGNRLVLNNAFDACH